MHAFGRIVLLVGSAITCNLTIAIAPAQSSPGPIPAVIERGLAITPPGAREPQTMTLGEAIQRLNIPSTSIAVVEGNRIKWAGAFGGATTHTIYQAASISKLVAALRLVEDGRLSLDGNVNRELTFWHLPAPVAVGTVPGTQYAYSGGGYEIVEALVEAATQRSFAEAVEHLVFRPAGMRESFYGSPPRARRRQIATGHLADGAALPGGWREMPELAAAGMWSTPTDLAELLIAIARAYQDRESTLLDRGVAAEMLKRQAVGPYGLGAAVSGSGRDIALMKGGQNIGYQSYLLLFPARGEGMVVMTNSDDGTTLALALVERAAIVLHWPALGV